MLLCMRTTLQINDRLYQLAKKIADETHQTLSAIIEDALRRCFSQHGYLLGNGKRVKLPTYKGKGLQPGVDLDDSGSVLDLYDF